MTNDNKEPVLKWEIHVTVPRILVGAGLELTEKSVEDMIWESAISQVKALREDRFNTDNIDIEVSFARAPHYSEIVNAMAEYDPKPTTE